MEASVPPYAKCDQLSAGKNAKLLTYANDTLISQGALVRDYHNTEQISVEQKEKETYVVLREKTMLTRKLFIINNNAISHGVYSTLKFYNIFVFSYNYLILKNLVMNKTILKKRTDIVQNNYKINNRRHNDN